jgi:hypothetical protein
LDPLVKWIAYFMVVSSTRVDERNKHASFKQYQPLPEAAGLAI